MDDAFQPPRGTQPADEDLDPFPSGAPLIMRVAGVAQSVAGAFVATAGTQLFTFFFLTPPQQGAAGAMVVLGVTAVVLGPLTLKGHATSAMAATGVCALNALLSVGWLLYAVFGGVLSPLIFLSACTSMLAALLAPFAIGPARRISAARKALYTV